MPPYFKNYSELIEKQQSKENGFSFIKWIDLIGFFKGRIIALQKCVIFSDIYIYISHLLLK